MVLQDKLNFKRYQLIFGIVFLVGMCLFFYSNTFGNGFVYDDNDQIVGNPWIRNFDNIPKIFSSGVWSFREFGEDSGIYYRPFMHAIFSIEYHFFQLKPLGYHVINVCWHAINAVVAFIFLRLLASNVFRRKSFNGRGININALAFLAAVIFATQPINSEVVNWISAIPELSFTLFFLLSFYFYIKANNNKMNYCFSLLFFFLSLLCKESAIMLPVSLLAYDLTMGVNQKYSLFKRIGIWIVTNYYFFAVVIGYLFLREMVLGATVHSVNLNFVYIFLAFIWGIEIFLKNIGEIIFPFDLSINRIYHATDLMLFYIAFVISILFFYFRMAVPCKYKDIFRVSLETRKLILIAIALFSIPLLPALNYISLPYYVLGERYLYLPSVGYSLLAAFLMLKIFTYVKNRQLKIVFFAAGIVLIGSFYLTVEQRNVQWKDELSLFSDAVAKNSDSSLAQLNLATAYCNLGDIEECKAHYMNLCNSVAIIEKGEHKKCLKKSGYNNDVGAGYFKRGDFDNAITHYKLALSSGISKAKIYNNIGLAYYKKHDFANAEKFFLRSASVSPNSQSIFRNLGVLYCSEGRLTQSEDYFSRALELGATQEEISVKKTECAAASS